MPEESRNTARTYLRLDLELTERLFHTGDCKRTLSVLDILYIWSVNGQNCVTLKYFKYM